MEAEQFKALVAKCYGDVDKTVRTMRDQELKRLWAEGDQKAFEARLEWIVARKPRSIEWILIDGDRPRARAILLGLASLRVIVSQQDLIDAANELRDTVENIFR